MGSEECISYLMEQRQPVGSAPELYMYILYTDLLTRLLSYYKTNVQNAVKICLCFAEKS